MSDRCIVCGSESSSYTIERDPPCIEGTILHVIRRFYCSNERCLAYRTLEIQLAPHRKIQELPA